MRKHIFMPPALALLLGGCGIYTSYPPTTEVPKGLFGEEAASVADKSWREFFTDPQLQELIERGLHHNTDLQSAQWRVKEAEATLLSARLAYLPAFALAPQASASSFAGAKALQTYSIPLTASWEVDLFGRIRNAKRRSKALLEQSQDYRQAVQTQVVAGIANAYYSLLMLDEQLEIAVQTAGSWQETVTATRALMEAGLANDAAVSQMEAACQAIHTSVLDLKEQINTVENSLSLLLGEVPHAIGRGRLGEQRFNHELAAGVPMELLARRPDVRSAQHALEAAFYTTAAARSAFYPAVVLGGSAGWTNSAGSLISNPAEFLASAVASLTQPLFSRGTLVAGLKIARAQQEEARLAFGQTLLNAGSEVNEALVQCQTARDKSDHYARQVAALGQALQSTTLLMQHGTTTYLEVLTAQQALLSARLTEVANRCVEIQGFIRLYQALGGGAS